MRRYLVLALLPLVLAACGGLESPPDLEGFQLLHAEELRLVLRDQNGAPFEGTFRVLTRKAPVVAGRTYLPLRGLVPSRDPDLDSDPWCTGTEVQVEWWDGREEEGGAASFGKAGSRPPSSWCRGPFPTPSPPGPTGPWSGPRKGW